MDINYKRIADISALLESLPSTHFESDEPGKILDVGEQPKDWEVGEAIAVYLIKKKGIHGIIPNV